MLPALCIAGVVTAIVSVFFVTDFQISANDLSISIFLGIFEIGIGFILMVLGARFVPAAQVGLLALVEPLFAPIWVWWGIGEVPSTFIIFGGLLIFLAMGKNIMLILNILLKNLCHMKLVEEFKMLFIYLEKSLF